MKKIIVTDLHFGEGNNSEYHNKDLIDLLKWLIDEKNKNYQDSELVIAGDTFHQRDKLSIDTINYAIRAMEMLSENFPKITILIGNHDMKFRDSRIVNSVNIFKHIKNVEIVDDWKIEDNLMYVSWICNEEEYDNIINISKKNKIKYMIGHYEFNNFFVNEKYLMEHGQTHKQLKHIKKVFSGHYHGRQEMDNIVYVGTAFPYNFGDANDPNKGFCVLDIDTGKYDFVDYDKLSVISISPEELFETEWENFDLNDVTLRVVVEDDIPDETLERIKGILEDNDFRGTKLVYKPTKQNESIQEQTDIGHLMSVDEAVISHISQMSDSENINKELLTKLYKGVMDE